MSRQFLIVSMARDGSDWLVDALGLMSCTLSQVLTHAHLALRIKVEFSAFLQKL
jgi:hypothetical protein